MILGRLSFPGTRCFQSGTRWKCRAHKWYAIRKSLGTAALETHLRSCRTNNRPNTTTGTSGLSTREVDRRSGHPAAVMLLSHFCQSHKLFKSEASQSHLKFFRFESWLGGVDSESSHKYRWITSSHWFARSSQCQVKWNFTFLKFHTFDFSMLWNGAQHAMKWRPIS